MRRKITSGSKPGGGGPLRGSVTAQTTIKRRNVPRNYKEEYGTGKLLNNRRSLDRGSPHQRSSSQRACKAPMINGARERIIHQEAVLLVYADWSLLSMSRKVTRCQVPYARLSHPRIGRSRGSSWSIRTDFLRTRLRPGQECTVELSSMGIDGR
jgi:hypothetical protein